MVMKSSGSQRLLVFPYTFLVTRLVASWEMMWERAMGILLELVGEARILGLMMFGCIFLAFQCSGRPRPTGVMMGAYLSGADSVSSSMLWEFALVIIFELGGVEIITGSMMLGLSRLDLRCVGGIWLRVVMIGGAVPGVLFLVF